jgi:hypothetical protein
MVSEVSVPHGREGLAEQPTFWQTGSTVEQQLEEAWARSNLLGQPLSDLLPPTRPPLPQIHHLPTVYSKFESKNGLKYSFGHNPQDLIVSGNTLRDTPEMCFTNLLDICQSNQVNNHDLLSQRTSVSS